MISESEMKENLEDYDEAYYKSIFLINKLLIRINDEIIIMNDHGPRIGKSGFKSDDLKRASLYDDMFYGIFVSRFKLSKDKRKFNPRTYFKENYTFKQNRYCDDGYGNINKIRELGEIEYCHLLKKSKEV